MRCRVVTVLSAHGEPVQAIVCTRGQRPPVCDVGLCGKPAVALCDYRVTRKGRPGTCDAPMCAIHRHPVPGTEDLTGEPQEDWCEGHFNFERRLAETRNDARDLTR